MSQEIELLRRFYDAVNRNDPAASVADFDAAIVRTEPGSFPLGGTYRGFDAVQAALVRGRSTWAEGRCNPESFFQNGDHVVVHLHAHVRLHGASDWIGGRFADGFVFRAGRIVEYHSFSQRADAMAWAGLPPDAEPSAV